MPGDAELPEGVSKRLDHRLRVVARRDRASTTKLRRDVTVESKVFEEVFDKPTLMTVYGLLRRRIICEIFGAVKAGKESKLYWAKTGDGTDVAVKIYLTGSAEFRKGMVKYIEGDPRFKSVKGGTRSLVSLWASKEFRNLKEAYAAGVHVPKPIFVENNVLVMEFVGRDGEPAPLLKDARLPKPERLYRKVLNDLRRLYWKARLVHGDLSEYNVMVWRGKPIIFDLSQAVSVEHPQALTFLKRDTLNLTRYFEKAGVTVIDVEQTYRWIKGEA